jgi:hypothetical protein
MITRDAKVGHAILLTGRNEAIDSRINPIPKLWIDNRHKVGMSSGRVCDRDSALKDWMCWKYRIKTP